MEEQKPAQDKRRKRLVVCVDDFGLDGAINDSVFALAAQARISATSCLVDAPYWRADARRLVNECGQRLDIGLHLNLSEAFPHAPAGHRWAALVVKAYARALDRTALQAEIERQFDVFQQAAGRAPDFVDGHRHVHQLPMVREALLDVLQRRGSRVWVRCTLPPKKAVAQPGKDRFKAAVIAALGGRRLKRLARERGLAQNRRMLGVYGFSGTEAAHQARLSAWLAAAGDGDLLMCHTALPGQVAPADPMAAARQLEHRLLAGDAFGRLLEAHNVQIEPLSVQISGRLGCNLI